MYASGNTNNIIQGIANEVLAAVLATFMIFAYLIYTIISFFKFMPPRNLNLMESLKNFINDWTNNNPRPNIVPPGNQQNQEFQQEFLSINNCSICLNPIQYEITTSCSHLFCGNFF